MLNRAFVKLASRIASFRRSTVGVAAVEFALVFPIALLIYIGAAEVSDAVNVSRKVETVSRTIVDLLSQKPTSSQTLSTPTPATALTAAQLQTLLTAATGLIYPASTSPLSMTLSAIDITNTKAGICCSITVRWSYTQNGTLRPCSVSLTTASPAAGPTPTTVPSSLAPTGTVLASPIALLVADVAYAYTPLLSSSLISFASGMSRTSYMAPRSLGQVIVQAPLPTSGAQTGMVCY